MLFFLRFSLLAVVVALAAPANAATFVVDSTDLRSDGDLADDTCEDVGGACTLQAAIEQANSTPGPDRIEFAIAGAGPHVIRAEPSGLAAITGDLVIDGYTQPGSSRNLFPNEMNAQIAIEIEASIGIGEGLRAFGGRVVLRGLTVRGFETCVLFDPVAASVANSALVGSRVEACGEGVVVAGDAVRIGGVANADRNLISNNGTGIALTNGSNFVVNNLIGTDASGTVALGNGNGIWVRGGSSHAITDNLISGNSIGVDITPASNDNTLVRNLIGVSADGSAVLENVSGITVESSGNQIGLPSPGRMNSNVISGNIVGVALLGPANRVQGNYFGTGPGGVGSLGNSDAILVYSSGNVIGAEANDLVQDQGNVIAFSLNSGILIWSPFVDPDPPVNNSLRGNLFYENAYIDIDLGGNGSDGIDQGDADAGANNRQNKPVLDVVTTASGQTVIAGKLDSAPGSYRLDFYSSPACDTGIDTGAGKFYLGSDVVTVTDVPAAFSSILLVTAQGNAFSAMATDANGNSSELARCFATASAGGANLSVDIAVDGGVTQVAPGDAVRFAVSVSNAGPATATAVPVVIARPAGFDSWSSSGAGIYGAATGLWSAGTLAPGASATRVFDATISASAPGLLTVSADAEQDLSQPDPDLAGNRSSVLFTVLSGAHLVVTQSVAASAQPGDSLSLELSVRNDGPENAIGVTLVGRLDAGLELDVASAPPGTSYNAATGNWSLAIGNLAQGDTALMALTVRVSPSAPVGSGLKQTMNASAMTPRDPLPGLSTAVVGVGVAADLLVVDFTKIRYLNPDGYEREVLESVTFQNAGPDDVSSFAVDFECNDQLPFFPNPNTCTSPNSPPTCPLRCVFGGLRAGESIEIALTGNPTDVTATVTSDPTAPHFDGNPSNNSLQAIVHARNVDFTCGLLGIESPILFGLLVLLRGRRGRVAFRRVFPGSVLALALVLGGSAPVAHASPVALTVDSAASIATISFTSTLGSPPAAPTTLSGSATADVALAHHALFGLTADSLQFIGAALEFSDTEILLSSPPLYELTFAGNSVGASLSGPSASGFAVAPGVSLFDVAGSALSFDTGTFTATGTYFGAPVSDTLDLEATPFTSLFPINSVAEIQVLDIGGGNVSLRLSLPFSAPLRLSVDGELATVTIAGTLVMNGVTVPEPASSLLLAPGLVGFGALRRRRSRQRSAIS